jgi:hypothetical protein
MYFLSMKQPTFSSACGSANVGHQAHSRPVPQ